MCWLNAFAASRLENNIPIVERKELARALYAEVEEGQEIPDKYYGARRRGAQIVYELQGETADSLRRSVRRPRRWS
ncbi:MAG: EscU/YscU/HrcU family type III secretion system export apparatus switch protein [Pirellulaceae bacterium]